MRGLQRSVVALALFFAGLPAFVPLLAQNPAIGPIQPIDGVAVGPVIGIGDPIPIGGNRDFVRGDSNTDGSIGLTDALTLLSHLFPQQGQPSLVLNCRDAADFDNSNSLGLIDVIGVLIYLFNGGAPPPAPFPDCGPDSGTQQNMLSCVSFDPCLPVTDFDLAGHMLRRMAYGTTASELDRVEALGSDAYIEEQLNPDLIDDSGNTLLNTLVNALNPQVSYTDLQRLQFARGLYSGKQLQEVLTDFFNNHFNTNIFTVRNHFRRMAEYNNTTSLELAAFLEHKESEAFRANALGDFQELVEISATSVTMLVYLDNISNFAADPNENYARELLELHTMGVDNGYTQNDVEEVARCFTGWGICMVSPTDVDDPHAVCQAILPGVNEWAFHFDPANHDYDAKTIFPGTPYQLDIPARVVGSTDGIFDGFDVIEHLVGLGQTADYVSTKLAQRFVSDTAPPALVASCIATWLSTDADVKEVMSTLLHSTQFLEENRWNKVRTPMESTLATVRAFDGTMTNLNDVRNAIAALSHLPFQFGTPDGFPETGGDQLGTAKVLERIKFNRRIALGNQPNYDITSLLQDNSIPLEDADAIVDFAFEIVLQSNFTGTDRQLAVDFLTTDDDGLAAPLDSLAGDYELRLQRFATFVASFPQALKQ